MSKASLKRIISRLLVICIGVFLIYSIFIQIEYRHYIKQSLERNYQHLSHISIYGINLADRMGKFVQLSSQQEQINDDAKSDLYDNWRVVTGESKSIFFHISAMSTLHTGDDQSDWSLLQYSLLRVDFFIYDMTLKFLEHHSYDVSSEELEKMDAVIAVYKTIRTETEKESVDLSNILQSIKEPMLVIDHNYQMTLDRLGR